MNEKLSLNPSSNCYEASFTIRVEAEIFQRIFFRYVEEHHIDITNPDAWQEAVRQVARIEKWIDHPRTQKVYSAPDTLSSPSLPVAKTEPLFEPVPPSPPEEREESFTQEPVITQEARKVKGLPRARPLSGQSRKKPHSRISVEQEQALIERAMALPVDRWIPDALTPIPDNLPIGKNKERSRIHNLRHAERYALDHLKETLEAEPVKEDRLVAIADAVNGARHR